MACDSPQIDTGPLFYPAWPVLEYSYYTSAENIKTVLSSHALLKSFEMTGKGQWRKLMPEKGTMNYLFQEAEITKQDGHILNSWKGIVIKQTLFLQFPETAKGLRAEKERAAACCDLVFVHFFENGNTIVQGIEIDKKIPSGFKTNRVDHLRLRPRLPYLSLANEPYHQWNVYGVSLSFAPLTSLTAADLEAL